MPIPTPAEAARKTARNCLRAFLEGKKTLNWVIGTIRASGVRGQELAEVFERLKG